MTDAFMVAYNNIAEKASEITNGGSIIISRTGEILDNIHARVSDVFTNTTSGTMNITEKKYNELVNDILATIAETKPLLTSWHSISAWFSDVSTSVRIFFSDIWSTLQSWWLEFINFIA